MKRALCLLAVLLLSMAGCQRQQEEEAVPPVRAPDRQPTEPARIPENGMPEEQRPTEGPPPEGQAFVQFIQAAPYTQWELWPGTERMYEGTEPHGAFLITHVNDPAFEAINQRAGRMPPGAIIVKENYTSEKELAGITAMYKVEGYNPEGGDWFWVKYGPGGEIDSEGRVEGCIGCHQQARDNDFLFTGSISPQ